MEELLKELIEVIKQSYSGDNIALISSIISCIVALFSLFISLYILFIQLKDRMLKKKVLGYIYKYYAPSYITDRLPTTKKILKELKSILFSEQDIFDALVELNKEELIQAVSNLDDNLNDVKWKPNMIFAK